MLAANYLVFHLQVRQGNILKICDQMTQLINLFYYFALHVLHSKIFSLKHLFKIFIKGYQDSNLLNFKYTYI